MTLLVLAVQPHDLGRSISYQCLTSKLSSRDQHFDPLGIAQPLVLNIFLVHRDAMTK